MHNLMATKQNNKASRCVLDLRIETGGSGTMLNTVGHDGTGELTLG